MANDTADQQQSTKIFVGKLDPHTTEDQLNALLSTVGQVCHIKLMTESDLDRRMFSTGLCLRWHCRKKQARLAE